MQAEVSGKTGLTLIAGCLFALFLGVVSFLQADRTRPALARYILHQARIVLAPGQDLGNPRFQSGSLQNIVDNRLHTFSTLTHGINHVHGAHLLVDLALSHWPTVAGGVQSRQPAQLLIYSGPCQKCSADSFRAYARPREVHVDLLVRRANNPDQEYVIPESRMLISIHRELEDTDRLQSIAFNLDPFPHSKGWPDRMEYVIVRLKIRSIYPGTQFPETIAIREIVYGDRAPDDSEIFYYIYNNDLLSTRKPSRLENP